MGYMGHLNIICDDILSALGRFPGHLRTLVMKYSPQPEWDNFVDGSFQETKKKEAMLLGGTKQ